MRIVALLSIRNEELHLRHCLRHLIAQGIEVCLIDNDSTDNSLSIAKSFFTKGVFRIENLPFDTCFELKNILQKKEKLVAEIDADWFIHHDADEIREASCPYKTLREGIEEADKKGFNAINFDEFVFLPTAEDGSFIGSDFVDAMKYYYYYSPRPLDRVNAWKNLNKPIDLVSEAGHRVRFDGQIISPQSFILRHYIGLSKEQLINKYCKRVYSMEAVQKRAWHGDRAAITESIQLPSKRQLHKLENNGKWDKSQPKLQHSWMSGADAKEIEFRGVLAAKEAEFRDALAAKEAEFRNTFSWKITKPLRYFKSKFLS